ncbi:MAG: hypothetical protein R6U35_02150, partial [Candidatus Humimicrobiaceae bacterium]
ITAWHKSFFTKFALIPLISSLILMVGSCSRGVEVSEEKYPPPQNLYIAGFTGSGADRAVSLAWEVPDTENTIIQFVVYRNGDEIARTASTEYQSIIGSTDYDFYITVIYEGEIESIPGNAVNTGNPEDISAVGPGTGKEEETKEGNEDTGLLGDGKKEVENRSESGEDTELKGDDDTEPSSGYTIISGPCGNPYYPVAEGISHTYKSSSGTITSTITSVHDAGFTVTHNIDGSTQMHEWECLPEGLVDLSNPIGDELKVMGEGITITGTGSATGVTIPASISAGDSWSQTYKGTLDVQEYDGALDFTVTTNYSAAGEEEITVSAGTFKAIKVDSTIESDFILKTQGISMPLYSYNATGTTWLVENVGPVKSNTQGTIEGTGQMSGLLSEEFSDTTELIEYSLP